VIVHEYKPESFDQVIEHQYIINFLKRVVKNPKENPKSFIFYGEFGVGKTTMANVFANELNKIKPAVVKKYNINVFNKLENFTDIQQAINNIYSFSDSYYVLIFDEMQRASQAAQQTLLDILENSEHDNIYYIFTTTDNNKILDTIKSRSIELIFKKITDETIKEKLKEIINKNNLEIKEEILNIIILKAGGHLRNAYNLLNLFIIDPEGFSDITGNCYNLIKEYLISNKNNMLQMKLYPVDTLIENLNFYINDFVKSELNISRIIKLLEYYMKFKGFILCIEDFENVMTVLKKIIIN
jgi:DNA polymerase III gamma/tau subunit